MQEDAMSDAMSLKLQVTKTPAGQKSYDPLGGALEDNFEVDEALDGFTVEAVVGAGTAISQGFLTTSVYAIIKNLDGTDDVTASWDDTDANSNSQRIPPGRTLVVPDLDPLSDILLVADANTPRCKVAFGGS
jgi:hypothetical protein